MSPLRRQLPPPRQALIGLTTDFGPGSQYVGIMKGVILGMNPLATLMDVTHSIAPRQIDEAAWSVCETADYLPLGTVHVVVVDPGVGSSRGLVYAEIHGRHFLSPDNGVLNRLAERHPPTRIVELTNPSFWRDEVSATFHGRDILAPVAAWLSLGLDALELGVVRPRLLEITRTGPIVLPGRIDGTIRSIDSFGNLITDIPVDALKDVPLDERTCITCDEHQTVGIFRTYADQPASTFLALIGSSGYLELAIVQENAAELLGITVGTRVTVKW